MLKSSVSIPDLGRYPAFWQDGVHLHSELSLSMLMNVTT